jgi:hypothetical protein
MTMAYFLIKNIIPTERASGKCCKLYGKRVAIQKILFADYCKKRGAKNDHVFCYDGDITV